MGDLGQKLRDRGAVRLSGLVRGTLSEWEAATRAFFDLGKPGHRIAMCASVGKLAEAITQASGFKRIAGENWRCVRAIAFNKTPEANWGLGWHQDRTIAVARREAVPGFEVWSNKNGLIHVEPPFALLERMVTLRIHLDPVDAYNAPLRVAEGSHRRGKLAEAALDSVVEASNIVSCHAQAGDGWLYATPIVHASARSTSERPRRVIHLDFSREALPAPLEWAKVG